MPDLFDVARHFDDVTTYDGYTGAYLFLAQYSNFMEAGPEGSVSSRRTMSTAPITVMPTRGVLNVAGERWLVGNGNVDTIFNAVIRQNFWLKKVTDTISLLTPGQAALGASGTPCYAHLEYFKDTVNGVSDADYDAFWSIYVARSETVAKGYFISTGSKLYRARGVHLDDSGLQNASSDELDAGAEVTVTAVENSAYDPVTDTYGGVPAPVGPFADWAGYFLDPVTGLVMQSTTGILMERPKVYTKYTEADTSNMAGDMSLILAVSVFTPVVGRILQIGYQHWRVLNFTVDQDAWVLHVRRT